MREGRDVLCVLALSARHGDLQPRLAREDGLLAKLLAERGEQLDDKRISVGGRLWLRVLLQRPE